MQALLSCLVGVGVCVDSDSGSRQTIACLLIDWTGKEMLACLRHIGRTRAAKSSAASRTSAGSCG